MRFGLVLGRLAVLNILDRAVLYATFEGNSFHVFINFFFNYASIPTKKLHISNGLNKGTHSVVSCSTRDTSPRLMCNDFAFRQEIET